MILLVNVLTTGTSNSFLEHCSKQLLPSQCSICSENTQHVFNSKQCDAH